jgi:DNA-directed RNA polymerase specialized sigma subunit
MTSIDLYNKIKAEGQVVNFYKLHQNDLLANTYEMNDVKQEIQLVLYEFLKKEKSTGLELLKKANRVVKFRLIELLDRATKKVYKAESLDVYFHGREDSFTEQELIDDLWRCGKIDETAKTFLTHRLIGKKSLRTISKLMNISMWKLRSLHDKIVKSLDRAYYYVSRNQQIKDADKFLENVVSMNSQEDDSDRELIWHLVEETLTDRELYVIYEYFCNHKNHQQIGKALKITRSAVWGLHNSAIKKLKQKLKKDQAN